MCDDLKRELKTELKQLRDIFERDFRKELREIKNSMTFMNKEFEEIKDELKAIRTENKELKAENEKLHVKCDKLAQELNTTASRILHCEQYSRNANIEIKGIPTQPNENLYATLSKIGDRIGESILDTDIEACHRVPVSNNPESKNIVVQFTHRWKRDLILEKARRLRLTAHDVGLPLTVPIYINEHLCPELKRLLGQTVAKKRESNWKYVWVRNGQIFARKAENTVVVKIQTSDDVAKIVNS